MFALDAALFGGVIFEHIEGYVAEDSHIFCGISYPDSASILSKANIQRPVDGVLHGPMPTDGAGKVLGVGLQATEEEAHLSGPRRSKAS